MSTSVMTRNLPARLATASFIAVTLLLGASLTVAAPDNASQAAPPHHQVVYVVYFNPADRECWPNYEERLDRVMTEVQQWYRDEMQRNGFPPMTFPLERDENGKLIVHVVKGTQTYPEGEAIATTEIRDNQVKPALLKEGIDIDQEHIIIFSNHLRMSEKDGATIVRSWAPYCGGGTHRSGTAWVLDCELLDPLNLPKKEPKVLDGGTRPYTLGGWVVTYMGGVAHEFGHALGLPHNEQTDEQLEELGYTLMGSGNYHLFGERAGQEKGSFLSKPHATILSSHPLFKRNTEDIDVEPTCVYRELEFSSAEGEYIIKGRVEATPRAYAVVAYHDLMQHHVDYDATSWVGEVDEDGRFEIHVGALKPGWYELRLRCFFVNGDKHELRYRFTLNHTLEIPADKLERQTLYEFHAKPAIEARDADALLAAIDKLKDFNDVFYRRAKAYYSVMTSKSTRPVELGALGDDVREVPLSSVQWTSADVGWEHPTRNRIPNNQPLESGEQFHEKGLYAHANSSFVYDLNRKWKKFTSGYGLQNMAEGSVIFVVKCDGKEVFRSKLIKDWVEGRVEIDLTGVEQLELVVEDGDNGKWADCGLWFSPTLTR